jgi:serine/threonine-protein kinase
MVRVAQRWVTLGLLGMGVLAGLLGVGSHATGAVSALERPSLDARFALRGTRHVSTSVIIVALDTSSYERLPLPPLPRTLDARLVDELTRAGARVIAFDISVERPSSSATADRALVDALRNARRAVVSVTAVQVGGHTAPLSGLVPFATVGVQPGVTLLELDPDGVVRRFPSGLGGVPSFAAATARAQHPASAMRAPARALIDYPGGPGTVPAISFVDVLHGRFDPRAVAGKIVVVGPTAPVLQDIHATPIGGGMAGPEIQADAIATALAGFPLRSASPTLTVWLLLGLGLLAGAAAAAVSAATAARGRRDLLMDTDPAPLALVAAVATLAVGWSVATQVAFESGTALDYADGMLVLLACGAASWLLASVVARRRRNRMRRMFAGSAPEAIAQLLGRDVAPASRSAAPQVIAGYRLRREVGRGGMGIVYLASQTHLRRDVALKLIRQELADDEPYRRRFEEESRLAAAVAHPNVIPVIDAGSDDGLLFIAMQYVDGADLAALLRTMGRIPAASAARLTSQVAGALDAIHARELVHRDVKPSNILIDLERGWHPYLTDFGVARQSAPASRLTAPGGWVGTADYLAPEQLLGEQVSASADVYALAAVFHHCITGAVPFPRDDARAVAWSHVNAPRPAPSQLDPDLPRELDEVFARAMALDPEQRYATAGEFAAALCVVLSVEAVPSTAAEPPSQGGGSIADRPTQDPTCVSPNLP